MLLKAARQAIRRSVSLGVAVVACAALLMFAAPAMASTWGWQGTLPSGSNGACPLYTSWGTCGPSQTNWYLVNGSNQNPSGDGVHVGFENGSAIRGIYLGSYQSGTVYASDAFSAGTAIRGEGTWCGWLGGGCGSAGWTAVWFQAQT